MCDNTPSGIKGIFSKCSDMIATEKIDQVITSKTIEVPNNETELDENIPPKDVENTLVSTKEKRCNLISCNKKLMLGARLKCRCGHIFCAQHIYSDEHKCIIDYKQIQQKLLRNSMPKTDFCKLEKI